MANKKAEMSVEQIENGQIVEHVAYPYVEYEHVTMDNGMDIMSMIRDDVSTPMVTHNTTSWKVGQGDSDVSESIVDSSIASMTIKGQTYQNILPSPSLRNSMTNGKTMQKLNEGYDSVNTVDGSVKSAILKGQTVNNLWANLANNVNVQEQTDDTIIEDYSEQYTRVTFGESQVNSATIVGIRTTQKLQVNKTYYINTFIFDALDVTDSFLIRDNSNHINLNTLKIEGYPPGQILSFTTQVETNYLIFYYFAHTRKYGAVNYGKPFYMPKRFIISDKLEDVVNQEFFEGMQSVKMPVLTSIGKNLFNGQVTENATLNGTGDLNSNVEGYCVSDFVKIKSNTQYIKTNSHLFAYYDENKKFISRIGGNAFLTPSNAKFVRMNIDTSLRDSFQLEQGAINTSYEPYKSNILHTPEEVVLRSVENAQDTINLNTGEYVQRIGEVVLNGSESWHVLDNNTENTIGFTLRKVLPLRKTGDKYVKVNCDKLPSYKENLWNNDKIGCVAENNINQDLNDTQLQVRVLKSTLSTQDTNGFKSWLQTNPLTIQYILETPVVKTVDLSSSGNWEKVVYSGASNESWSYRQEYDTTNTYCFKNNRTLTNALLVNHTCPSFSDNLPINSLNVDKHSLHINGQPNVMMKIDKKLINEPTDISLKQYLHQNPITVWYQTATTLDSTNVKEMLSFSNGHVQLSSAEGSLIPSLSYETPTSNSYHVDLMKPNTQYTMKNMQGTFTIDNIQYNASTNGTFTSPSALTNKFMITSVAQSQPMLLEGDVREKDIPYFKGIKSAFEDESKIEVLSTGKNWVNLDNARLNSNHQKVVTRIENGFNIKFTYMGENFTGWDNAIKIKVNVKPNTNYTVSLTKIVRKDPYGGMSPQPNWVAGYTWVRKGDSNNESFTERNLLDGVPTTMKFNSRDYDCVTLDICSTPSRPVQDGDFDIVDIQVEESSSATVYESYKSNITSFQLAHPLRSLPNGVRDEIVLDRMSNKAKLIQRVGSVVLDGSFGVPSQTLGDYFISYYGVSDVKKVNGGNVYCDKFKSHGQIWAGGQEGVSTFSNSTIWLSIYSKKLEASNIDGMKKWLSQNPVTVYYELETPVITEVNLEGYPYVYKDGHIFLNTEIAPITEVTYSINQAHQIESSNEDILRHQNEINHLYQLIAQYVQVQYEAELIDIALQG